MSNKYYIPEIEEFHVGFEYEVQEDGDWIPKVMSPVPHWSDEDRWSLEEECIRVKKLDEEDVINLGFKKNLIGSFERDNLSIVFSSDVIYISDRNRLSSIVFQGFIKNKSELIRILKQVNIP